MIAWLGSIGLVLAWTLIYLFVKTDIYRDLRPGEKYWWWRLDKWRMERWK